MSYTPKQQGTGGSAGQQSQQAAKTLAGITQQMQNLVHGQNAIPQTSQTASLGAVNFANLNITLQQQQQQQQRIESIIKQQQLLFSAATPQIQQHFQQQIQQQQNAAKDLLNKSLQQHHQQQANGSTASASLASNLANQQLHQQLQAFAQNPANLMQHIQAYQYQMQQQQHQQKILPLNQTQQSLAPTQLDVQNVTQQHMQQIQQSCLQQQKLLAATHAKNVSSTNQMKPPVNPNNSNSFPLSNASVQIQSNNNLPNKSSVKGVVPPVVAQVVKQAISSPNPAAKTPPIQTTKTHTVPSSVIPKPASILPPTTKAPPVLYPQKSSQNNPISLTRTTPNTVSNSSQSSKTPASIQQAPRSNVSPHQQISTKAQDVQQTSNHGKPINADVNKNPKQTLVAGKPEVLAAHSVQSSSNQTILPVAPEATSNFEAKTNEITKPEADKNIEKDKSVQNDQKEKHSLNSVNNNAAKEVIKVDITDKTQENAEQQKQERDKEKKPINSDHIQAESTATIVTTDSAMSSKITDNISKNDANTDQTDVSGKVSQKVNLRLKSNQRRNQTKSEKDKNDIVKSEKMKEKSEKDKCNTEKEKDGQNQKEKDQQQQPQQQQHKEMIENNKLTKEQDTKENNENDKTGKEKIIKEKSDKNTKSISKSERKRNFAKEVSASLNKQLKSGIQQQLQHNLSSVTSSSSNIDGRRSKRHRLKTILYQSPLPELAYITKLSVNEVSNSRNNEEKLILFYKSEYLAVRNAEGGFFICQTLQNVYKSSKRIRIRWFSEEKKDSTMYNPDFYDNTDLECVLTTVELEKMGKDRFKLPKAERARIENILKKAMDVEKGITPRPNVTEENPDGLDISLLKVESQLSKVTSGRKRIASKSPKRSRTKSLEKKKTKQNKKFDINEGSSQDDENDEYDNNDKEYKPSRNKRSNISAGTEQLKIRAQRSPLAKTRQRSSPSIIPNKRHGSSKQSNKSMPPQQKTPLSDFKKKENIAENETVIPETHKTERPKRKAVESIISYDEELVAAKRLAVTKQTKKNDEVSSKINDKDNIDESAASSATAITSSKKNQTTNNVLEPISSSTNVKSDTVKSSITSSAEVKVATTATAAAETVAATPPTTTTAVTATTIKTASGGVGSGAGASKKKKTFTVPINKISNSTTTPGTSDKDKTTPQHPHPHQTSSETSVSSTPAISSSSSIPASSTAAASASSLSSSVSRLTRSRK